MSTSGLRNASILITGANGGIGMETVKLLMQEGVSRIALACRTQEKAELAKAELQNISSTQLEAYGGFDMTKAESIHHAVLSLSKDRPFDVVFLQSGGMVVANEFQFVKTNALSLEKTIYQNVLGGYLTVKYLEESNLLSPKARIVFAGGEGARGIPGMIEKPVFPTTDDLRSYILTGRKKYNDINALGVSKFMNALLVQKLATLDKRREYVWFSPGLTGGTKGLDAVPNPKRFVMKHMLFPTIQFLGLAQGPKQAAKKYLDCLAGKYGKSGDLIGAPAGKALGKLTDQKPMNLALINQELQDAFWEIVVDSCGDYGSNYHSEYTLAVQAIHS